MSVVDRSLEAIERSPDLEARETTWESGRRQALVSHWVPDPMGVQGLICVWVRPAAAQ